MITIEMFESAGELDAIDAIMENTCEIAVLHPRSIYRFMLRFVSYCRSYGFCVPRLAGVIGSSPLFRDASAAYPLHSERSMEVAASVLSAAIEEFKDPHGVSHRTLAYGLLDRLAQFANLSQVEIQEIYQQTSWLSRLSQEVDQGYSADPTELSSMVRAMGFHFGAETVGGHEATTIHKVLFQQQKGTALDQFLRQHKLILPGGVVSPTYWVAIHGTEHSVGVETAHAEDAIKALNQVLHYSNASELQVIRWADEGFAHFNRTQIAFFQEMKRELQMNELMNCTNKAS